MKAKGLVLIVTAAVALFATSCASIVSGGSQKLNLKSDPTSANVVITNDSSSQKVFTGTTPAIVSLKKGDGFFKGANYTVVVSKEGYKNVEVKITSNMNGWFLGGNLVFGGLIGWLIVDPMTGAMWTLSPKNIDAKMQNTAVGDAFKNKDAITIVMRSDISDADFNAMNLTRIN
jgi:hypothetical protein